MMNAAPARTVRARQHGAATIEFYIVAFLVFIPLLMAVLQMGLFMVAKNTVNTAALNVARAGAASGGNKTHMEEAFANSVMPLYAATGLSVLSGSGAKEITKGNYPVVWGAAYARARLEVALPLLNRILLLNPTSKSFADFGINKAGGVRVIPVTNLDIDKNKVGPTSGQTRADSLLLKVELHYCYAMAIPIIDDIVAETVAIWLGLTGNAEMIKDIPCTVKNPVTGKRGVPIVSQAVVRITVPPVKSNF